MVRYLAIGLIGAALASPAFAEPTDRCCRSEKGPEPVFYTGAWENAPMTRKACVALKYGFWDGDTPNVAKKVCALKPKKPDPVDPVPPPHEEHREPDKGGATR